MSERQHRNLPSTFEVNLRREGKKHCKVVTLWSGKTLEQLVEPQVEDENLAGSEKSSAEVVEKLVKKPVSDTPEKVEAQRPMYDDKPIIPYP